MIVFDLEADNLLREATTLHCIVLWDSSDNLHRSFYDGPPISGVIKCGGVEAGIEYLAKNISPLNNKVRVAGHNITGYDFLLINKLYPGNPLEKISPLLPSLMLPGIMRGGRPVGMMILDTFILSCLLWPQRPQHGLESWGEELGILKPEQAQWHTLDAAMLNRCLQDVKINTKLLLSRVIPKMNSHMEKYCVDWRSALAIECIVNQIHAEQGVTGVRYNVEKAVELWQELNQRASGLKQVVLSQVPKRVVDLHKGTPVNKPFKKDGGYSKMVVDFFKAPVDELVKLNIRGPFTRIGYEELNLDSDNQVKEYLLSLGWKPTEWNKSKVTGERTSPKLTEDSYDSLPDGVGRVIADYNITTHRRGLIANNKGEEKGGIWKVRDDGRVAAEAFTCGTPTSRYRHQGTVCNIPRPSTPYGSEIRALYCVPSKWWQLGLDLKGIEIRMAAHFAYPYPGGEALAEEILSGDFHTANAILWGVDRNTSKTGLYLLMYGGKEAALARALGKPVSQGKRLYSDFWELRKPLKMLNDDVVAAVKRRGCLIGLDGRRVSVREERKALNTLIQGASAVIFKHWMFRNYQDKMIASWGPLVWQIIAYHDEIQYEVRSETITLAEEVAEIYKINATEVGKYFNIAVPIEADSKIGKNWKETH